ncbi:MAG: hypothetical protein ACRDZ1_08675 [Acidimicrobiia bacterium]
METLFLLLPVLGCTAMMIACAAMMWGRHRMMSRRAGDADAPAAETTRSDEPAHAGTRQGA